MSLSLECSLSLPLHRPVSPLRPHLIAGMFRAFNFPVPAEEALLLLHTGEDDRGRALCRGGLEQLLLLRVLVDFQRISAVLRVIGGFLDGHQRDLRIRGEDGEGSVA